MRIENLRQIKGFNIFDGFDWATGCNIAQHSKRH